MTLEELMELYKLVPGFFFKVVSPNKFNNYLWTVEIWKEWETRKPVAIGCALRAENAFIDARDNLKKNV
jgi:hypothetical protein